MEQSGSGVETPGGVERVEDARDHAFGAHTVRYVARGAGPAMLFLHNGGTSHRIWDAQIAHFARSHAVFALDLLGHGGSSKPEIDYTLPLYVRMLRDFIDGHRLTSVTLVGNCIGSATALQYALSNPRRVTALVLCHTLTSQTLPRDALGRLFRAATAHPLGGAGLSWLARDRVLPAWMFGLELRALFGRGTARPAEIVAHLRRLHGDPARLRVFASVLRNLGALSPLDGIVKPRDFPFVCSVWGRDNRILPVDGGERFCRAFGPDRAVIIDRGGHLVMCDHPARLNRIIERACEDAAARAGRPAPAAPSG